MKSWRFGDIIEKGEPFPKHWKRISATLYEGVAFEYLEQDRFRIVRSFYRRNGATYTPIKADGTETGGSSFSTRSMCDQTRQKLQSEVTETWRQAFRKRLFRVPV